MDFSIVIPAFNEERRLAKTLDKVRLYLKLRKMDSEVIVVDDGSRDGTGALVRRRQQDWPGLRLITNEKNQGKGHSVRKGVLAARGKQVLFSELDNLCKENVILASNTSSLCISKIASESKFQERIVGIHFFNPAPIMKLIELIKGKKTSDEVLERSKRFAESLDKTVVVVNDSPGFVTTRLLYVLCNEAINMKLNGIASTEDIDTACKLAFNFPMGPIEPAK